MILAKTPSLIVPGAGTSHAVRGVVRWRLLPFLVVFGSAWAAHAHADFDSTATAFPPWPHAEAPESERGAAAPPAPKLAPPESRAPAAGYAARPFHLELIAGVATTVGLLGVAGDIDLGNALSLGGGIGTNILGRDYEAHVRVRPLYKLSADRAFFSALTLEAAFASSLNSNTNSDLLPFGDCNSLDINSSCYDPPVVPERVYWAQAELGWEVMFASGVTLRLATGFAQEIRSPNWHCRGYDSNSALPCHSLPARLVFVQAFAVGYAF